MPLPAALLARLRKRGICASEAAPPVKQRPYQESPSNPDEEVIAESYDDDVDEVRTAEAPMADGPPDEASDPRPSRPVILITKTGGAPGCPNKINPFHTCVLFCFEEWGTGRSMDSVPPKILRRRLRMLRKYPLPTGWAEVYDPGTGRHFYWNMETDNVTWLSPSHPKAFISPPANKMGKDLEKRNAATNKRLTEGEDEEFEELFGQDESTDAKGKGGRRDRDKKPLKRGRAKQDDNDLDPMDPSSYSECPRGTWHSGLERGDEAKSGVDDSVSGPLFQMRPYPSPGAILRANAGKK